MWVGGGGGGKYEMLGKSVWEGFKSIVTFFFFFGR